MKEIKFLKLLLILCSIVVLTPSCEKVEEILDPCLEVICKNDGKCVEGVCNCPEGFSGPNCETEDLCITQNPDCKNGGTCVEGVCECAAGYEGESCAIEWREKMVGEYTLNTICDSGEYGPYSSTVSKHDTDPLKALVSYPWGTMATVYVEVIMTSANTFDVPTQLPCPQVCYEVEGSGSIDNDGVITISLALGNGDNCSDTFMPK